MMMARMRLLCILDMAGEAVVLEAVKYYTIDYTFME